MPDPIQNIIQKDVERVNRLRSQLDAAWDRWNPLGPESQSQEAAWNHLRRQVERAEKQLNQTFLSAPRELRLGYLKERFMR